MTTNFNFTAKASTLPPDTTLTSVTVEPKKAKDPEKRKSREFPKSRDALVKEALEKEPEIAVKAEEIVKTEEIAKYDHEPHVYEGHHEGHPVAEAEIEVKKVEARPTFKETDVLAAMMVCETGATVKQKGSETVVTSLARVGSHCIIFLDRFVVCSVLILVSHHLTQAETQGHLLRQC